MNLAGSDVTIRPDVQGGVSVLCCWSIWDWSWEHWTCSCGNEPEKEGFYVVELTTGPGGIYWSDVEPGHNWGRHYRCDRCMAVYESPPNVPSLIWHEPAKARPPARTA